MIESISQIHVECPLESQRPLIGQRYTYQLPPLYEVITPRCPDPILVLEKSFLLRTLLIGRYS